MDGKSIPMKTIITSLMTAGIALLPISNAAAKTFGGFSPGKTFTLTVKQVNSTQTIGYKAPKVVPIPSGIPKFKVGDKVKFEIGKSGQLKGPDFILPYVSSTSFINTYSIQPSLNLLSPNGGIVTKNTKGQPTGCALDFYKYRIPGTTLNTTTINQVTYILEPQ